MSRSKESERTPAERTPHATVSQATKFNIDFLAIGIALTLAALIRLNILPQIKW